MASLDGDSDVPDSLINSFALVAYLPEPLAGQVEAISAGVHADGVRAHVTILPPRPLCGLIENAAQELEPLVAQISPFEVELCEVKVFPRSDVLYISIGEGAEGLKALHSQLSSGRLRFLEYFEYHPHVTLAQALTGGELARASHKATQDWNKSNPPHRFLLDRVMLVQNTQKNQWRNLHEFRLGVQVTA